MEGNGQHVDPNTGLFVVQITYNPVNKQISVQFRPDDHLLVFGMLELAKSALVRQQVANATGPKLVVPRPVEPV